MHLEFEPAKAGVVKAQLLIQQIGGRGKLPGNTLFPGGSVLLGKGRELLHKAMQESQGPRLPSRSAQQAGIKTRFWRAGGPSGHLASF